VLQDMVEFDRREWFARQILVHEARLRGYLGRFLKSRCDVADGVQETYARLLGLPDPALASIRHPRAFLFTAARNVALEWRRRERWICGEGMAELAWPGVLQEEPSAYEELRAHEDLVLLARAIAALPKRCRQVLTLRKLNGLSQKEIARRLGISENTVEKQTANGVRLCAGYFEAWRGEELPAPGRTRLSGRAPRRDRGERVDRKARRRHADAGPAGAVRALAGLERAL
jgi:RNA polymerase sigma factor (sigma-70 family)